MSYCRFGGDSDVYAYPSTDNTYVCCGCSMRKELGINEFDSREELLLHLKRHRLKGDVVPDYAFERIFEEMEENGEMHYPTATLWDILRNFFKPTYYIKVEDSDLVILYKVDEKRKKVIVTNIDTRENLGIR